MKRRSGFVSNSSSSSYIIAIKPGKPCEHCGRSDPDILTAIRQAGDVDDDSRVRASGEEEVLDYIKTNYMGDMDEDDETDIDGCHWQDVMAHVQEAAAQGYTPALVYIANCQEGLEAMMRELSKSGNLLIIYERQ